MGFVKKSAKDKIIQLMLKEVPTEEIANQLHYSVGTIRKVFEELRDEYGVTSKIGIAIAYLSHEISKLNESTEHILQITGYRQMTISPKDFKNMEKRQKFYKKKKRKN